MMDQTEDDYGCAEDDDSVTGYCEEDGFAAAAAAASSLPFQYEEGQKCRDYPYWENGTECPFYIAQDESSSRYPDVKDEDSACRRDLVADVVVTGGGPLTSTYTDGSPPDTPSTLSPTTRDEVKSEDDRPATKTEIDAPPVRAPASYTKSSSPKSSRRPSWLQKMLMAV
jgi:hypothetical protein